MDKIDDDLYDKKMRVIFSGFIRPQLQLKTIEELKKAIQNDIQVSMRELEKSSAKKLKVRISFLMCFSLAFQGKLIFCSPFKSPERPTST